MLYTYSHIGFNRSLPPFFFIVARLELLYLLVLYALSLPFQLVTTSSFLEQGSGALVALTAIHAGIVAALFWTLLGWLSFCYGTPFPLQLPSSDKPASGLRNLIRNFCLSCNHFTADPPSFFWMDMVRIDCHFEAKMPQNFSSPKIPSINLVVIIINISVITAFNYALFLNNYPFVHHSPDILPNRERSYIDAGRRRWHIKFFNSTRYSFRPSINY